MLTSLDQYPRGFVVACLALGSVVVLWVVFKLLKFALWLLFLGILVVAGVAAASMFFR